MADPRDHVELTSIGGKPPAGPKLSGPRTGAAPGGPPPVRPWLSIYFRCSNSYARAYRNAAGTGYQGRCPRCGKSIRFMVGPGGTSERMFQVSC